MIYITGDTHGGDGYGGLSDMTKLNTSHFEAQKDLTKSDYLIISGDCGIVFYGDSRDKYWIKWLNNKSFTTLFIDGNHDNFSLINKYPLVKKFGGYVHKISDTVYHLMRGYVYSIENKRVFVMGGGESHDKRILKNGKQSWWDMEIPSDKEFNRGLNNLDKLGNKVDIILSHEAPDHIKDRLVYGEYKHNKLTNYLEVVSQTVEFQMWYFGHYHKDIQIKDNKGKVYEALYQRVVPYLGAE